MLNVFVVCNVVYDLYQIVIPYTCISVADPEIFNLGVWPKFVSFPPPKRERVQDPKLANKIKHLLVTKGRG